MERRDAVVRVMSMDGQLRAAIQTTPMYSVVIEPSGKIAGTYLAEDEADSFADTYNIMAQRRLAVVKHSISDQVFSRLQRVRPSAQQYM
jgi:hypothetical protein